jgi:lipid-A-disaccharide synthase
MEGKASFNIVMVAGEASGDLLGGDLIFQIKQKFPDLELSGVGGPKMKEQGLSGPYDVNDLSVIGLVEVVRRLPGLIRVFRYLTSLLREKKPKLLITIDLPDFNFLLAGRAKALGIPIVHYVSPQVWAWRSGRVDKIARLVDHLLVLFPFEAAIYEHTKLPVTFVGHPLVEKLRPWIQGRKTGAGKKEVRHSLGIADDDKMVVLLPGSRHSEVKRLLAIMLATYGKLVEKGNRVRYVMAQADTLSDEVLDSLWPTELESADVEALKKSVLVRQGATYDLLMAADAALVASGTATLETALLGTPMVVLYRVNQLTYEIGKRVIKVPFIALANLVAERKLVNERIQAEANPTQLADDLDQLLNSGQVIAEIEQGYQEIRDKLAKPLRRPIDVIADFLSGQDHAHS